jgi:hypothetical protein
MMTFSRTRFFTCEWRTISLAVLVVLLGCGRPSLPEETPRGGGEWREFRGEWTAAGSRDTIQFGGDRRASTARFSGTLMLSGPARPNVGFRAEAIVLSDSATGMVGRAVWTDERGDQVYSELKGEGTATGNRIVGTIVGGTGRYRGATGSYEFSWHFVIESRDGSVQGQSTDLKGRVRMGSPGDAPNAEGSGR